MTVDEVDVIMVGHPRSKSTTPYNYANNRNLPLPSVLAISYSDRVGATEGDYELTAYFDKDGKMMDSDIGEYVK